MIEDSIYEDYYSVRVMLTSMFGAVGLQSRDSSPDLSPIRKRSVSPESRKGEVEVPPCERFHGWQSNYSQIADKNAQELIEQEEQAKVKSEKKRAKKKRQRQKKKEISEEGFVNKTANKHYSFDKMSNNMEKLALNTDNKEAEGIDVNAAFVDKSIKKLKKNSVISETPKNKKKVIDINYFKKTALDYENKGHYKEAVQYLSDAINLFPKDCDLFLKRSFIYYQLAKFKKSIRDAERVLEYSPNNIEGYYRLGEGHFAINNSLEAETAFTKLLSLNAYTDEASKRIFSIRLKQLQEMGYHPNEAFTALLKSKNKSLDEAIDFLTDLDNGKVNTDDLYYSDEEEESDEDYDEEEDDNGDVEGKDVASGPLVETALNPNTINRKSPLFTDPSNPTRCRSLFVGNLKKDITYKEMEDVFIKFGDIKSIKLTTEPNCYGFVNYEESDSAGRAMGALQGSRWLVSTAPLTIRYPTNATINSISSMKNPELVIKKLTAVNTAKSEWPVHKPSTVTPRVTTPVPDKPTKGILDPSIVAVPSRPRPVPYIEDCLYWRTTGCIYGDKCFNLHRPGQRGIDLNYYKPAS